MAHRMRIERGDNRWLSGGFGLRNRLARNSLMPQMESVKIAQCRYCTAQVFRNGIA